MLKTRETKEESRVKIAAGILWGFYPPPLKLRRTRKRKFMPKILKIVQEKDPILRKKAEPVKNPKSPEIKKLIADMIATMMEIKGIGLAAPQVGASCRIFTANVENKLFVFINPEIKDFSSDKSPFEEGCLSVQKVWGPVIRPKKLTIKALNENGKPFKIRARGLLARVIQHEMDHLNGTLFIDKAEKLFAIEENKGKEIKI